LPVFFCAQADNNEISNIKEEVMDRGLYEESLPAPEEGLQSGQSKSNLTEKERQFGVLNMSALEGELATRLQDLLVEIERKEMLLRQMEGRLRRLERKSRWHVAMAY
jgi:hypothetical protein